MSVPAAAAHEEVAGSGDLTTVVPGRLEEGVPIRTPLLETLPGPGQLRVGEFNESEKRSAWIVRKLVGVSVIPNCNISLFV